VYGPDLDLIAALGGPITDASWRDGSLWTLVSPVATEDEARVYDATSLELIATSRLPYVLKGNGVYDQGKGRRIFGLGGGRVAILYDDNNMDLARRRSAVAVLGP
jgi:hypothetical protein